jgi:septal ring factor EnvC (AmiA/AmiB activator)
MFKYYIDKFSLKFQSVWKKIMNDYSFTNHTFVIDEITGEKYSLTDLLVDLQRRVSELEDRYTSLIFDVRKLEDENVETTNTLYEITNSIDAVDARIDILTAEKWTDNNV